MEDSNVFIISLMAIIVGFFFNQIWISLIFAAVMFLVLIQGKAPEAKKSKDNVPMPLVRPIIVKRKYTGPESIYPSKMEITYNPKYDPGDWKGKSESVGSFIGNSWNWLTGKKK